MDNEFLQIEMVNGWLIQEAYFCLVKKDTSAILFG